MQMMLLMAATLAIGATAGWKLEQRYGVLVVRWGRQQLERIRGSRW
ncbi:MAG TPA: hypothetical protein VHQ90_19620 [Thermoanaerobaculia bacterium]|nr:hypothetical protein [Thermoanaerobaculia bacterium]